WHPHRAVASYRQMPSRTCRSLRQPHCPSSAGTSRPSRQLSARRLTEGISIRLWANLAIFEPFCPAARHTRVGAKDRPRVEGTMAKLRIAIAAVLVLCELVPYAASGGLDCRYTPAWTTD